VAAPDFNELRNDIGDRLHRINLMGARGTKQRLNICNVAEDEGTLVSRLAVIVRRPGFETAKQLVHRRAQEDHRLEARVEAALIRDGSGDVERRSVLARKKFFNEILPPDVSAVCLRPLAPRCIVGLDDLKAALCEFGQRS
jgi:hypothetical protein